MGNMSGSYGSHYTLWQSVTINRQDTSGNYTNVTVRMYLTFDGSSYYSYTNNSTSGSMTINGGTTNYSIASINFSSGQKKDILLAEWTDNIEHDSNGEKLLEVSGSWETNTSRIGSGTTSSSVPLTKINRYPSFTEFYISSKSLDSITYAWNTDVPCDGNEYSLNGSEWKPGGWPHVTISQLEPNTNYSLKIRSKGRDSQLWSESSIIYVSTYDIAKIQNAPNINIGDSAYISWTNPTGSTIGYFLEALYWDNSEHKITVRDVTYVTGQLSTTINLTESELNKIYNFIPHLNQCTLRYGIRTFYSNKSKDSFVDRTGTIVDANPIFNDFNYNDTDSHILRLTNNSSILVKDHSDVIINIPENIKAQGQKGATIQSYKAVIGNQSKTFNNSSDIIYNVNNNVIDVFATDSRGNSTKVSKTVEIKNYFAPQIEFLLATRENGIGENITLDFRINFWNENFGLIQNTLKKVIYRYKITGSNEYIDGKTALTYNINGNIATGTIEIAETFELNDTYNIELYVSDELEYDNANVIISAGNPALAVYKNRVAVGGRYNENYDDPLQVHGKARFFDKDGNTFQIGENEIYWKEKEYGDKFKVAVDFNGFDDDNKFKIMSAVGGFGENPELYDIMNMSAKSGNMWIKGAFTANNLLIYRGWASDLNEIKGTYGIYSYTDATNNKPDSLYMAQWGCVINFHVNEGWYYQVVIGNFTVGNYNKMLAIRASTGSDWTDWHYL